MANDNIKVVHRVNPETAEEGDFIRLLSTELGQLLPHANSGEPFIVRIGQYHCSNKQYAWQADITFGDIDSSKSGLHAINSHQYYDSECVKSPEDSYRGKLEITVGMARDVSWAALQCLVCIVYTLYYDGVEKHFDGWSNRYLNAPSSYSNTGPFPKDKD